MIITFDKSNAYFDSAAKAYGQTLVEVTKEEDFNKFSNYVFVFCLDQHEAKKFDGRVTKVTEFVHPPNAAYIFGKNHGESLSDIATKALENGRNVRVITISGKTLWAETALGVILHDREMQKL
jgi:hypothetical protein